MKTIKCKLNCEEGGAASLHMRPSAYICKLCNKFPRTEFRIMKAVRGKLSPKGYDAKSIMALQAGYFLHGEEVTLEVDGECEIMASEFFKTAWENLLDFTEEFPASEKRLAKLIDETFNRIQDPDVEKLGGDFKVSSPETQIESEGECRSVAVINDRLHNLSLAIIPQIARHFKSHVQIAFEVPLHGIFAFTMEPENRPDSEQHMLEQVLQLPVEVGTRITILSWDSNRFRANAAVRNVLQNLWQCDDWLRKRAAAIESEGTIEALLEFAEKTGRSQSPEYGFIQNPYISNLLTRQHIFVNPATAAFSKDDVLSQLAAAHASINKLEIASVMDRVKDAEKREPIVLREGFAIAHGAMDRTPRISITFGVYPNGVTWDESGRIVRLVSMIVFAKDTYGTWRDYLRKLAIVFRDNPHLLEQLVGSKSAEEFRTSLRQTETAMIK